MGALRVRREGVQSRAPREQARLQWNSARVQRLRKGECSTGDRRLRLRPQQARALSVVGGVTEPVSPLRINPEDCPWCALSMLIHANSKVGKTTLAATAPLPDRKSTRLNSSHVRISY